MDDKEIEVTNIGRLLKNFAGQFWVGPGIV